MSFDDYFSQFTESTICKYNESFHRDSIRFVDLPETYSMFNFTLTQESTVHLMVYQTYEKIGSLKDIQYKYALVKMIVAR